MVQWDVRRYFSACIHAVLRGFGGEGFKYSQVDVIVQIGTLGA
jgi:hypothetical protein